MRVRANKTGYFNGLHIPDTDSAEFEVPNGTKGSWFEPVAPAKAAAPAKKGGKAAEAPAADTPDADQDGAGEGLV